MRKWPRQHVRLFASMLFFAALFAAAYILLVRPLSVKVADDTAYIESTKSNLVKTGWPLDPGRLASLVQMKKKELDGNRSSDNARDATGIRPKSQLVLQHCTSSLNKKIKSIFDNTSDFTRDVTRLDYQEAYNELEQKLAARGIFLSDEILNLGETTSTKDIYRLLLQVWMLDKFIALATSSGMRVQTDYSVVAEDERGRKRQAARLQFLPIIGYHLYEDDKTAYVLEIPLRLALQGNANSLCAFLRQLQTEENFFPVSRIQIFCMPELKDTETQFSLEAGNLSVELECSAFFCPQDVTGGSFRKPAPPQHPPAGA